MTEDAFLSAIRADPGDAVTRLVYADWLDDHGDPRGELVRVEEEMRTLPVFDDRFWGLKPRRNELRAQSPAEWLKAMGYGTVAHPVFRHGWPDGLKQRWRLIREFIERWHGVGLPDAGGRPAEVAEVEARLGYALPESVREWVALAYDLRGDRPFLTVLRDGVTLQDMAGQDALSLLRQGEGDYDWGVRHADLGRADPPVYGYATYYGGDDEPTFQVDSSNPVAGDLTTFVISYALGYAHGINGFTRRFPDESEVRDQLDEFFSVHQTVGRTEIFEADNLRVLLYDWRETHYPSWYLSATVAGATPPEAVPPFLWAWAGSGAGSRWGLFDSERFNHHFAQAHPPQGHPDEDIPF